MMTYKQVSLIIGALAALVMTGASLTTARADDWRDIRHDRRDIRRDRHDIHKDEHRLHQLHRQQWHQRLSGHSWQAHRTGERITRLHRDVRHDRHDIRQDRRDIRHDSSR